MSVFPGQQQFQQSVQSMQFVPYIRPQPPRSRKPHVEPVRMMEESRKAALSATDASASAVSHSTNDRGNRASDSQSSEQNTTKDPERALAQPAAGSHRLEEHSGNKRGFSSTMPPNICPQPAAETRREDLTTKVSGKTGEQVQEKVQESDGYLSNGRDGTRSLHTCPSDESSGDRPDTSERSGDLTTSTDTAEHSAPAVAGPAHGKGTSKNDPITIDDSLLGPTSQSRPTGGPKASTRRALAGQPCLRQRQSLSEPVNGATRHDIGEMPRQVCQESGFPPAELYFLQKEWGIKVIKRKRVNKVTGEKESLVIWREGWVPDKFICSSKRQRKR